MFYDRLVDDKDRSWFLDYLKSVIKDSFAADFDKLFKHLLAGGTVRRGSPAQHKGLQRARAWPCRLAVQQSPLKLGTIQL